jgi:hypothetical protein
MMNSVGLELLRIATMARINCEKNNFSFPHFGRSSFFTVILNGAKRSEKSPRFQNNMISSLRCEMTIKKGCE